MQYVRFPLSLRNVEDLLHGRGVDVSYESARYWWHWFVSQFARLLDRGWGLVFLARGAVVIVVIDRVNSKKELFWVKIGRASMHERGEDFGELDEDAEIQNLLLYTERKADGIYRYRRRVPKRLISGVGKGDFYRNLGRTKQNLVGRSRSVPFVRQETDA